MKTKEEKRNYLIIWVGDKGRDIQYVGTHSRRSEETQHVLLYKVRSEREARQIKQSVCKVQIPEAKVISFLTKLCKT